MKLSYAGNYFVEMLQTATRQPLARSAQVTIHSTDRWTPTRTHTHTWINPEVIFPWVLRVSQYCITP